jgi:hypothetical protein
MNRRPPTALLPSLAVRSGPAVAAVATPGAPPPVGDPMFTPMVAVAMAIAALLAVAPASARADGDADDDGRRRAIAALEAAEPSAAEVRDAALRYAGLGGRPQLGWGRRARLAGLLPTLTLRASRGRDWDRDLSGVTDSHRITDLAEDSLVEARAVWRLDRLVFDPAELRAATVGRDLHRARLQIAAQVTSLWYQRRSRQLEQIWHPADSAADDADRELAIAELTDQLDALTGGFLSDSLASRREHR